MAFSRSVQRLLHPAVGHYFRLSATNHPDAAQYQGMYCTIVAVKIMRGGEPMLIVQFPDGIQVAGLFFCELEDEAGRPLQRSKFERTSLSHEIR
jgi:hypothetical protein